MRLWWPVVLAFVLAPVTTARADGPYEGSWRPGPMRIEVGVDSWGADCPPQPRSTTTPGGGPVHVTQSGDHLTFPDGHTTRDCWSANPAVHRVSSTYSDATWRIVCRSPADDSRRETGTYTLRASTIDRIEFRDVTDYDWSLNESHCTARITTTQTFERVSAATPVVTPTTPVTVPDEPPAPACTPGAPARIAMRPASTTLAPGERACITARVVDANGCAVGGASPAFELRAPSGQSGELHGGCFTASPTAAGTFVVTARSGALSGETTIQVRVLDLSDLIARRTEAGGVAGEPTATTGSDARVAARTESARAGMPLWAVAASICGLVLVLVAVVGLLTRGRRRRAPRREEVPFGSPIAGGAPETIAAPPVATPSPVSEQASASDAMICPVCRRGYAADVAMCPKDREPLVPYATFVQRRVENAPAKICPKCGTSYAGNVKFCGKDGTTL
jgi:hypothetical protein